MSYSFVFLGLSITSSWGNGHATTYRALLDALVRRGHDVLFLERDLPFYADNRDLPHPPFGRTELYTSLDDLKDRFTAAVRGADVVVVGSYVPEGARVIAWVQATARGRTAFYDIDTPVTVARLARGEHDYLAPALVPRFDLYLSFTGGPMLDFVAQRLGARRVRPLYCSVDPRVHYPEPRDPRWDLGYLGTYSEDRQPALDRLLLEPARALPDARFAVAGAQYPGSIAWPANVERACHVPPGDHRAFYGAQRYTLNITRRDMAVAGHSPSVRLFEAAACEVPVISDPWPGLDDLFLIGREIFVARSAADTVRILRDVPEEERLAVARRARARVLGAHTAAHRAEALERYAREALENEHARATSA